MSTGNNESSEDVGVKSPLHCLVEEDEDEERNTIVDQDKRDAQRTILAQDDVFLGSGASAMNMLFNGDHDGSEGEGGEIEDIFPNIETKRIKDEGVKRETRPSGSKLLDYTPPSEQEPEKSQIASTSSVEKESPVKPFGPTRDIQSRALDHRHHPVSQLSLYLYSPTENVETELYIAEERVHASSALVRVRSEEKEIAFDCGQRDDETKDLDKRFNEKSLSVTETKDALFESTSYHKEQSPSRTKAPLPQRPRSSMGPKRQSALRKGAGSRVHGNEEPS